MELGVKPTLLQNGVLVSDFLKSEHINYNKNYIMKSIMCLKKGAPGFMSIGNGTCLMLSTRKNIYASSAEKYCNVYGGHVFSLTSDRKQIFWDLLNATNASVTSVYTGFTDFVENNVFKDRQG
jgi:hypothetical protein